MENKIAQIEQYVKSTPFGEIAHDFSHVDRVRHWAIKIATAEKYPNVEVVEAAALLHDIGLHHCLADNQPRWRHGEIGAATARKYLNANGFFTEQEVDEIENAIRYHNQLHVGSGQLLDIIRDADMMDLFGPIGLLRAISSMAEKPISETELLKGKTWGFTGQDFDHIFQEANRTGVYIVKTIVDQINFHISCVDNLATSSAKEFAKPKAEYLRQYILDLEKNILEPKEVINV